jgi:hypothetical protein
MLAGKHHGRLKPCMMKEGISLAGPSPRSVFRSWWQQLQVISSTFFEDEKEAKQIASKRSH